MDPEVGARLGSLIRSRRESVSPRMSQAALGDEIGLDQRSVSNLENGVVEFVRPDVANKLVAALPLTMGELLEAMGFNVATRGRSWLTKDLQALLDTADEREQMVLQAVLRGLLAERAGQALPAPKRARQPRRAAQSASRGDPS